jgi:peptide/nickel transport system substrate-binding protein
MKKKFLFVFCAILIFSMVFAACTPNTGAQQLNMGYIPLPENPKTVTAGWTQEPDNIVPFYSNMTYAAWLAQFTLEGLAEWNENGDLVPDLAAEIPSQANGGLSADGLTLTWKLKPDLKWSDGESITSADVKFTWEQAMSPDNACIWKTGYNKISSIDTPDNLTVVIHFSELYPPWPTLFTQGPNNAGAILPKHILEGHTKLESDPYIHMPTVASGPFVISEWVAGDHLQMLPNPNFYGGRPKLDQVLIRFIPDPETALAALQSGDIDLYPDFSESDIETLNGLEPAIHTLVIPDVTWEHYFFNLGSTTPTPGFEFSTADKDGFCPFKDVRVRKAIILAINRQEIVDNLLGGKTTIGRSQWDNSVWVNENIPIDPYDPEKAKQLLDEAGYTDQNGDGIREGDCNGVLTTLSVVFNTTNKQIRQDIAVAVQSNLAAVGIEFKPEFYPGGTYFASFSDGGIHSTGAFDMGGYTTGFYPDPYPAGGDYACDIYSTAHPDGRNAYFLCDPQLVTLMEAVNASADPAVRKTALDAVQQYIYDQSYIIMMYMRATVDGYADRLLLGPFSAMSAPFWNTEVWDVKQ